MMKRAMQGDVVRRENIPFVLKDGTTGFTTEIYLPLRTSTGEIRGVVANIRDVTQTKIVANNPPSSTSLQAQLLDSVQESIVATDLDGNVTYWNKGAEKLYGFKTEEVIGNSITFIVLPQEKKEEERRMQQVFETGSWVGQYIQQRRDGSSFLADTRISLVKDEQGNPCGFVGIDREIQRSLR